jgi:hypothetical protein
MHEWLGSGHWYGMGFGWLLMLAPLVLVVALIVLFVQQLGAGGARARDIAIPEARAILDERFARAEIDQQEYEARRELLKKMRCRCLADLIHLCGGRAGSGPSARATFASTAMPQLNCDSSFDFEDTR